MYIIIYVIFSIDSYLYKYDNAYNTLYVIHRIVYCVVCYRVSLNKSHTHTHTHTETYHYNNLIHNSKLSQYTYSVCGVYQFQWTYLHRTVNVYCSNHSITIALQ